MKELDSFMKWFRDEDNLANLRTGTTVAFIIIFVIYFYGFRTGFQVSLNDVRDMVIDMVIVVVSAFAVINDFSMRGVTAELDIENEELKGLVKKHKEKTDEVDEDKLHLALVDFNKQEDKKEMERVKRKLVRKYKRKRRNQEVGSRKYKKLTKKVTHFEHPETFVKFKRRQTTVDDLIKRGAMRKKGKEINENYNPHRDTVSSQSGMVFVMLLFTSMMRIALEPSWHAFGEAMLFLSWLLPFLLIRAILSYQIARKNTENNYPLAIKKQLSTLEWCMREENYGGRAETQFKASCGRANTVDSKRVEEDGSTVNQEDRGGKE